MLVYIDDREDEEFNNDYGYDYGCEEDEYEYTYDQTQDSYDYDEDQEGRCNEIY